MEGRQWGPVRDGESLHVGNVSVSRESGKHLTHAQVSKNAGMACTSEGHFPPGMKGEVRAS